MTKPGFTSINVIIDKSGSMAALSDDTIGSFNTFLKEQKDLPGEAVFTLCTFNTSHQLVHDFVKLADVTDLDSKSYHPYGGTALLDAMGTTINSVGAKLAAMSEEDRPSKVLFLIITDGQENSSRSFSKDQIKSMVEHQQAKYSWEFSFFGANIDTIAEGYALGIDATKSISYNATPIGTRDLYKGISRSVTKSRTTP